MDAVEKPFISVADILGAFWQLNVVEERVDRLFRHLDWQLLLVLRVFRLGVSNTPCLFPNARVYGSRSPQPQSLVFILKEAV